MKKITLFLLSLLFCHILHAEVLAKVDVVGGCRVFTECTPVAKYDVLGEINLAYTPTASTFNCQIGGMSLPITSMSQPTYLQIRDGLIAQGVMANREVNGIIISDQKGTLIRFHDLKDSDFAIPNKRNGMYLFVDSHPIADYEFIERIKASGIVEDYFGDMINKIVQKASRKLKKKPHNGAIFHFGKEYSCHAEIINIH